MEQYSAPACTNVSVCHRSLRPSVIRQASSVLGTGQGCYDYDTYDRASSRGQPGRGMLACMQLQYTLPAYIHPSC
jgi:hypothetical protein